MDTDLAITKVCNVLQEFSFDPHAESTWMNDFRNALLNLVHPLPDGVAVSIGTDDDEPNTRYIISLPSGVRLIADDRYRVNGTVDVWVNDSAGETTTEVQVGDTPADGFAVYTLKPANQNPPKVLPFGWVESDYYPAVLGDAYHYTNPKSDPLKPYTLCGHETVSTGTGLVLDRWLKSDEGKDSYVCPACAAVAQWNAEHDGGV